MSGGWWGKWDQKKVLPCFVLLLFVVVVFKMRQMTACLYDAGNNPVKGENLLTQEIEGRIVGE